MDPITAFSVAAAALQFLDFGSRIIADTREAYKSALGQRRKDIETSMIAKDISTLTSQIESKLRELNSKEPSHHHRLGAGNAENDTEAVLIRLCQHSTKIGDELQELLAKIQARGHTTIKLAASSLVAAVEGIRSEEKILDLKKRLDQTHNQITMAILVLLWARAEKNRTTLLEVSKEQAQAARRLQSIDEATRKFSNTMEELLQGRTRDSRLQAQKLIKYVLQSKWQPSEQIITMAQEPASTSAAQHNRILARTIAESLPFETINNREEEIPKAYADTYEWIFKSPPVNSGEDPSWSNFSKWLSSQSNELYWITGKPGAGKSTLVKFMIMDKRLKSLLHKWASPSKFLLATYFSWNAGNNLQKSHQGLLRTLLYQCVQQCQESLIPAVFPSRWALLKMFNAELLLPDWEMEELMAGFRLLISHAGRILPGNDRSFKLAIIIDGLDEFEAVDHTPLVQLLQEACMYADVKICASSRPWNVFRDAFHQNPMLRLETLTRSDIQSYIHNRFHNSQAFREWSIIRPSETEKLLRDVLEKAQGVFLWVSVVTQDLLLSLQEGDRLSDLQETLNGLPDDVSQLYEAMWKRTNKRYHGEAAEYFSILETYYNHDLTPYTLGIWLGDDEISLDIDLRTADEAYISQATLSLQRRLNSRTRGLLEIYPWKDFSSGGIDYMHRTVREWVGENWNIVEQSIRPDFEVNLRILKGETLRISTENYLFPSYLPQKFWGHLGKLFGLANDVRNTSSNNTALLAIMDKLDSQLTRLSHTVDRHGMSLLIEDFNLSKAISSPNGNSVKIPHWCNGAPRNEAKHPVDQAQGMDEVNFVGLMSQIPVPRYLETKIPQDPSIVTTERPTVPLLVNAIVGGLIGDPLDYGLRRTQCDASIRVDLVRFLLPFVPMSEVEIALDFLRCRSTGSFTWKALSKKSYISDMEEVLQNYKTTQNTLKKTNQNNIIDANPVKASKRTWLAKRFKRFARFF